MIVQAEPATPNSPLKEINRRVRKNKNKRNGKSHTGKTIHRLVIKLCLSRQAAPWRHHPPPPDRAAATPYARACYLSPPFTTPHSQNKTVIPYPKSHFPARVLSNRRRRCTVYKSPYHVTIKHIFVFLYNHIPLF